MTVQISSSSMKNNGTKRSRGVDFLITYLMLNDILIGNYGDVDTYHLLKVGLVDYSRWILALSLIIS